MNFFNDPAVRVTGMMLLAALIGVLLVWLIARLERRRHFWKYIIPALLLGIGIWLFALARATGEPWGAIGYMVMSIVALVSSIPGLVTAVIMDVSRNKKPPGGYRM